MLRYQLPRLDGSELAQLWLRMLAEDLKECIERGRRAVILLVEGSGSRLDTVRVGCVLSVLCGGRGFG
jgi:hypothetical protein